MQINLSNLNSLNAKKVIIVSTISVCVFGAVLGVFRFYNARRKRNNKKRHHSATSKSSNYSLRSKHNRQIQFTTASPFQRQRSDSSPNQNANVNAIPSEELLELGLDYLNQAIKCWQTALDNIESAAYMQSQLLALPNNEHSDLVYKLRILLEQANGINANCTHKLINSSKTLQIIQSRLASRQQQYAAALLSRPSSVSNLNKSEDQLSYLSDDDDQFEGFTNTDRDDVESFVSANSDADWIDESVMIFESNLYEIGLEEVNNGRVACRVFRTKLLNCKSDQDFLAKLYAIRLGFDKLLENETKRKWFIEEGKNLLSNLIMASERDPSNFHKAYDQMVDFAQNKNNAELIKTDLATRDVLWINFYDIILDFILLDAFDDLDDPPGAIVTVINNRWLSQSFKETALSTAVWSVIKAKRRLLKYPNAFISHFYSINEHLVPVLAWGFLGTNTNLKRLCFYLKSQVVEYLKCLFNINKTNYTTIDHLSNDIEAHTIYYLRLINNQFTE